MRTDFCKYCLQFSTNTIFKAMEQKLCVDASMKPTTLT